MKFTAALVLGFLVALSTTHQAAAEQFVFLGDSLVDNQNSFIFTNNLNNAGVPIPVTPLTPPYFDGRFSNGINWTDRLAPTQLYYADYYLGGDNCSTENPVVGGSGICDPALDPGSQPGASLSFAFGGSLSGDEGIFAPGAPGFLTVLGDLENYVQSGRIPDLTGSVFGVWTGGNDYSAFAVSNGGLTVEQAVDQVLDNIEGGLLRISALGANRALVLNIFPLDRIPSFVTGLGPAAAGNAQEAANLHNAGLPGRLENVRSTSGMDIVLVDVDALYTDIFADPLLYGFTNLTIGCITDDGTGTLTGACTTAEEEQGTLYWDGTHPTTAAHAYIHELVTATLQAVDEDGGRLATVSDSVLIQTTQIVRGLRSQFDAWRADTVQGAENTERNGYSMFAVGTNSFGTRSARGNFSGYDYDARGVVVGFENWFGDEAFKGLLGAHIGYTDQDSEIGGGGSFDSTDYAIGVHAGLRSGNITLTAQAAYHSLEINSIARSTGFSVLNTAFSETTGDAFSAEFEIRSDFSTALGSQTLWLAPLARLTVASTDLDGFMETGARFLNLTIDDTSLSQTRLGLGVNAWTEIQVTGGTITPVLTAVWERNISDLHWTASGRLPSSQAISSDTDAGTQEALLIELGVRLSLGQTTEIQASVSTLQGTGSTEDFLVPQIRLVTHF